MGISFVAAAPICYDTGNFTTNSTYGKNRDLILASLPPNVSASGGFFFNASIGQNPHKVYALGMCIQGDTSDRCSRCLNFAIHDLMASCPNQKEALSWGGDLLCLVRYADRSFYGNLEVEPTERGYNTLGITSNLAQFDTIWASLIDKLVSKASNGNSSLKYATGEADFTVFQRIYALMQCTPDLSRVQCSSCLWQTASDYDDCCHGQSGGYVRKPSCYLRWDLYPFYLPNASNTDPTSPPASIPGSPPIFTQGKFAFAR
ncbi:hypothetical protein V6N12_063016 [Hibiscus sabdariffa]|uniref:Gnk2-homologous domain-containing protein n=1 Tax=Hibiscus sabdariffa TaxID=183260 RepID=A0ABR2FAJ0_9ROSI